MAAAPQVEGGCEEMAPAPQVKHFCGGKTLRESPAASTMNPDSVDKRIVTPKQGTVVAGVVATCWGVSSAVAL